jgi:gamma-glutamyltranspeptidase/glutathione hydrolase
MILLQMLGTLEAANIGQNPRNSSKTIQILTEASRFAYRDRARFAGDPDFQLIPSFLWEKDRVQGLARMIRKDRFLAEDELGSALPLRPMMPLESENTTHFSVMDENGMAVANTYTLEDSYGSHQVSPGGFLLNNEMGDFNWFPGQTDASGKVGTPPNLIAPGKRMLSSQTPVIVLKENRAWIVSGSPGGRTIPNTVTQTILNIMEFQMGAQDGVDYPRVHHQWMPEILRAEKSEGIWDDSINQLGKMGMKISRSRQGDAHTLVRKPGQKTIEAGIDHRIEGAAAGN